MFFRSPNTSPKRAGQRNKWIAALKNDNANGSAWIPKADSRICSAHFIGGDRSLNEKNPSYVPTIFPNVVSHHRSQSNKVKRSSKKSMISTEKSPILSNVGVGNEGYSSGDSSQILDTLDVTMESEAELDTSLPPNECGTTLADHDYLNGVQVDVCGEADEIPLSLSFSEGEKIFVDQECQSDGIVETMEYVDNDIDIHGSNMVTGGIQEISSEQVFQKKVIAENNGLERDTQHEYSVMKDCESEKSTVDQACQATIFLEQNKVEPYSLFHISREVHQGGMCDVEIQTNICFNDREIRSVHKKFKDVACSTTKPVMINTCVGPNTNIHDPSHEMCSTGLDSIKSEEKLLDLAGVSFETFHPLFSRIGRLEIRNWKVDKRNRLLIFLTKIKSGLTYSALSAIFCVSRSTVSRIFLGIVEHSVQATQDVVLWPTKELVQATMLDCFKRVYGKTRVIIDCTEFRIEQPTNIDHRVWCYSNYEHGFTGRVLIGITPRGFISFKSKVAGGRKSDSQITVESGLLKLREGSDIVLADKGFPELKTIVDDGGEDILIVMPLFLKDKAEFATQETEDTHNIASVRIHVERMMQRLRIHKILDKIPQHLFKYVDDIVHICCVLVNLQPCISAAKENGQDEGKFRNLIQEFRMDVDPSS